MEQDVKDAAALLGKECKCCGRPWTVSALAQWFGIPRITLHRRIADYRSKRDA